MTPPNANERPVFQSSFAFRQDKDSTYMQATVVKHYAKRGKDKPLIYTFSNDPHAFQAHFVNTALCRAVESAALGKHNVALTHHGISGSGKSTHFRLLGLATAKKLFQVAEDHKDVQFLFSVRFFVGDLSDGPQVQLKQFVYRYNSECKSKTKNVLTLVKHDDSKVQQKERIKFFKDFDAFESFLNGVVHYTERYIQCRTAGNDTSSRAFQILELTVESKNAEGVHKKAIITLTDEVGNEKGDMVPKVAAAGEIKRLNLRTSAVKIKKIPSTVINMSLIEFTADKQNICNDDGKRQFCKLAQLAGFSQCDASRNLSNTMNFQVNFLLTDKTDQYVGKTVGVISNACNLSRLCTCEPLLELCCITGDKTEASNMASLPDFVVNCRDNNGDGDSNGVLRYAGTPKPTRQRGAQEGPGLPPYSVVKPRNLTVDQFIEQLATLLDPELDSNALLLALVQWLSEVEGRWDALKEMLEKALDGDGLGVDGASAAEGNNWNSPHSSPATVSSNGDGTAIRRPTRLFATPAGSDHGFPISSGSTTGPADSDTASASACSHSSATDISDDDLPGITVDEECILLFRQDYDSPDCISPVQFNHVSTWVDEFDECNSAQALTPALDDHERTLKKLCDEDEDNDEDARTKPKTKRTTTTTKRATASMRKTRARFQAEDDEAEDDEAEEAESGVEAKGEAEAGEEAKDGGEAEGEGEPLPVVTESSLQLLNARMLEACTTFVLRKKHSASYGNILTVYDALSRGPWLTATIIACRRHLHSCLLDSIRAFLADERKTYEDIFELYNDLHKAPMRSGCQLPRGTSNSCQRLLNAHGSTRLVDTLMTYLDDTNRACEDILNCNRALCESKVDQKPFAVCLRLLDDRLFDLAEGWTPPKWKLKKQKKKGEDPFLITPEGKKNALTSLLTASCMAMDAEKCYCDSLISTKRAVVLYREQVGKKVLRKLAKARTDPGCGCDDASKHTCVFAKYYTAALDSHFTRLGSTDKTPEHIIAGTITFDPKKSLYETAPFLWNVLSQVRRAEQRAEQRAASGADAAAGAGAERPTNGTTRVTKEMVMHPDNCKTLSSLLDRFPEKHVFPQGKGKQFHGTGDENFPQLLVLIRYDSKAELLKAVLQDVCGTAMASSLASARDNNVEMLREYGTATVDGEVTTERGYVYMVQTRGVCTLESIFADLQSAIKKADEAADEDALRKFRQELAGYRKSLLHAMIVLHQGGMTHGDLKAPNVVRVGSSGTNLQLIDFGSSWKSFLPRTLTELTTLVDPEHVLGTESVMDGQGVDVYATAMLLVQFLNDGGELMDDVTASPSFVDRLKAHWNVHKPILLEESEESQQEIANSLVQYFAFCDSRCQIVKNAVTKRWPILAGDLFRLLDACGDFPRYVTEFSLESGTQARKIRCNKAFASEKVAVRALLLLLHPISTERMSLEDFKSISSHDDSMYSGGDVSMNV